MARKFARDWDQILTLPRRLSLRDRYEVDIEPAGDLESLRYDHRHIGRNVVTPDRELVLDDIGGDAIELNLEVDPRHSSLFEVDVLRSPNREEYTRICLYPRRAGAAARVGAGAHRAGQTGAAAQHLRTASRVRPLAG